MTWCTCPDAVFEPDRLCPEHGEASSIDDELELARAVGVLVGDDADDDGRFDYPEGSDPYEADDEDIDEVIR